jgi:2-methylisocitrate lyase-like PEP mutase family enzyme
MTKGLKKRLRDIARKGAGEIVPGASNALAARIIEAAGFSAVYVSVAGIANGMLGVPDIGLTTLTEVAETLRAVRDVCTVPLVCDADTGFGNAVNCWRTVRVLERAGADAIQLEDQDFPKRCGHFSGKSVIPRREMENKIKAAVDARTDAGLMIIARTDALALYGLDEAIERCRAYVEAGADMTFLEAPTTSAELARIPNSIDAPQLVNIVAGGLTPMIGARALAEMGFAIVLYANASLQASMFAMRKTMRHLKDVGSLEGAEDQLVDFATRQTMIGKGEFDELEQRFS